MNKNNTLVFITLAISFILSTLLKPYPFSWAVKMLPIFLLIAITWQHSKQLIVQQKPTSVRFFIFGLLLSSCGDFLLDYNQQDWFIFGLAAFFIAHLCYLISLKPFNNVYIADKKPLILITYIGFGVLMFMLFINGLGELFIPVLAYMVVLLLMALATVFSHRSNLWLVLGGISFVLSDSLIGFDKFNSAIVQNQLWVMATYYFAQFALVKGYLMSLKKI
ncbi:MAG: lysoplasmalogenase [Colwellia sp.]|uniref:lysoplasmalogenase n=1 Tax=Colwellia sp. TaxID=56799 RepID=UPI001D3F70E6|nr:lysoplasmalogenase [Colwellia sp.]NQY48847.1 lysoplasmalogenase [Colwellia sp.]